MDRIADPGAISIVLGEGTARRDYIVVRFDGKVHVYENACPHQGTPLETLSGRFFNHDQTRLLCSTHGAEFRVSNGVCTKGPCQGKALRCVDFSISDGAILMHPDHRAD